MKKLLLFLLAGTMVFSLVGCGDNGTGGVLPSAQSSGEGAALTTDFQKDMRSQSFRCNAACETETGFYFQYAALLYYMDKESRQITPVCAKPDCQHTDGKCNAWLNTRSLNYCDSKIYFDCADKDIVSSGILTLFSMGLDGTGRKEVQALAQSVVGGAVTPSIIHRGTLYYVYDGAIFGAGLGGDIKNAVKLYGDIQNSDSQTVHSPSDTRWSLWADGDKVYFMGNLTQKDQTQKDTLFCYDTVKQETKQVWQTPDAETVGKWETTGVHVSAWYIKNGALYYYLSGNGFWRCNLETGENEQLADVAQKAKTGTGYFSDKYLFVLNTNPDGGLNGITGMPSHTGGDTLYVYSLDGSFVKEISLKDDVKGLTNTAAFEFVGCSGKELFLLADQDQLYGVVNQLLIVDAESGNISTVSNWPGAGKQGG